jgi:hypothetical protein
LRITRISSGSSAARRALFSLASPPSESLEAFHLAGGFGRVGEDRLDRPDREALDHAVGQQPFGEGGALLWGERATDDIARAGGGALDSLDPQHVRAADDLLGDRIGHARPQGDLDHERAGGCFPGLIPPGAGLDDRIGEQFGAEFLPLGSSQLPFQEVEQFALDLAHGFEPERMGVGKERFGDGVAFKCGTYDEGVDGPNGVGSHDRISREAARFGGNGQVVDWLFKGR